MRRITIQDLLKKKTEHIINRGCSDGTRKKITEELSIPTIGIGAGPHCDGQVLVLHDVIGLFERFLPKFAKRYANLKGEALNAIRSYKEEVGKGIFPSKVQSFK